jgi:(1->4)-alpha-D-glucan 1-alpha-D-glucosylmutase
MARPPRIPDATYRVQLDASFDLRRARELVEPLAELGISHLYSSPLLQARRGSAHGYDVVDPTEVDRDRGGFRALDELAAALHGRGMGLLVDIVPNHMAASAESPWFRDVLRRGRDSEFAGFFDVDWGSGGDRIVLPLLGAPLDELARRGELALDQPRDGPVLRYHEHAIPVRVPAGREPPRTVEELLSRLDEQAWRLVEHRAGARELNYRRFFDIDGLIALRADDPRTFDATHALPLELAERRAIDALRIDHVDGLLDPQGYLERLRAALAAVGREDAYVVVEKILSGGEDLPGAWPCDGTTGYEFGNALLDVFVERRGFDRLDEIYRRRTGVEASFADVDHAARLRVLRELFPAELARLAGRLERLAGGTVAPAALSAALEQVCACLPVYRTYVRAPEVGPRDREPIERALAEARRRAPLLDERALACLREVLLLEHGDARGALDFVLRWQQLTGPVMAKGHEDTALYRYHRLDALNVVGGDPGAELDGLAAFHSFAERRVASGRHDLSATSTHDSKRGEDVQARLHVLSEIPHEWDEAVGRWSAIAARHGRELRGATAPDANERYFAYQTLVGAWPAPEESPSFGERLAAYFVKSAREAKQNSSWRAPDEEYERALVAFATGLLGDEAFLAEFLPFQRRIAHHGARASLAQVVLKVASPGVPDFYQGAELWDLSLVDPDNRRPVDFAKRRAILSGLATAAIADLLASWPDGRIKAFVTRRALLARRRASELFRDGAYVRLETAGPLARRICAFARVHGRRWAVAAVPRLLAVPLELDGPVDRTTLAIPRELWADTRVVLPPEAPRRWTEELSGRELASTDALPASDLFAELPAALLLG